MAVIKQMHLCKFIFHIHIHSSVVPVLLPEFLTFFIPTTKALNADHVTVHFILSILVSLGRFRFVAVLSSLVMSCFIWFYLYWLKTCFPKWLQQNGFVRRKNWAVVFTFLSDFVPDLTISNLLLFFHCKFFSMEYKSIQMALSDRSYLLC